jgi:hypothetical protein
MTTAIKAPENTSFNIEAKLNASEGTKDILLVANSGTYGMELGGWPYPLYVDMEGAYFDKDVTPILQDHSTSLRVGHTKAQMVIPAGSTGKINGKEYSGPAVLATVEVSATGAVAKEFEADFRNGFPFQVSIGAKANPQKVEFIDDDETASVNGIQVAGPCFVSRETKIKEVTVTVFGADPNTTVVQAKEKEGLNMNFEAWVESLGLKASELTKEQRAKLKDHYDSIFAKETGKDNKNDKKPDDVKATDDLFAKMSNPEDIAAKAEDAVIARVAKQQERIDRINEITAQYSDVSKVTYNGKELSVSAFKQTAITNKSVTPAEYELVLCRAERELPEGAGQVAIHVANSDVNADAISCNLVKAMGVTNRAVNSKTGTEYGYEVMFDQKTLEASDKKQNDVGLSLQALMDMQIRAAGKYYTGNSRSGSDFIQATHQAWQTIQASGFSGLNVTNILENTMHKMALASFNSIESVWPMICGRKPLNDFRVHNMYRLSADGSFKKVATDGELKHVSMSDTKYTLQADMFGAMITVDRKTIKNDDMGMILDQARALGSLGAQRIEESVFVMILANGGSFFSAPNGNLLTGAGSALSADSLDDAREKYRNQVINGKPVGLSPRMLLVPTTLETTANRLFTEERFAATGDTDALVFTNNQHRGLYRPITTPYLNNTSITDQDGNAYSGQSDTQWYLLGDPNAPQGSAFTIGFLDGRSTPYFDQAETTFSVPGGMQFRSYLDWGTALNVTQQAVKSAGA